MKLKVIGSGSSGNCYVLETGSQALIIEAGIQFSKVKEAINFDINKIKGCLISHSHSDHSKRIKEYLDAGIQVFSSPETFSQLNVNSHYIRPIPDQRIYTAGEFSFMAFKLEHDVTCYGYLIDHPQSGLIVFITDTHYSPYTFPGLNHILIEANYQNEILNENINNGCLPEVVKNRILFSHISLDTCKEFLKANDLSEVKNIVLLHLSDGNSNAELFRGEIEATTGKKTYIADKGLEIDLNTNPF